MIAKRIIYVLIAVPLVALTVVQVLLWAPIKWILTGHSYIGDPWIAQLYDYWFEDYKFK